MSYTAGAGAAAAAVSQAIKASGAIVTLEPQVFRLLLDKIDEPLVVMGTGGLINKNYQYLVGYKGLIFHTKSSEKLMLPLGSEMITCKRIWIPA